MIGLNKIPNTGILIVYSPDPDTLPLIRSQDSIRNTLLVYSIHLLIIIIHSFINKSASLKPQMEMLD